MHSNHEPDDRPGGSDDPHGVLPESSSLVILLILFFVIAVVTIAAVMSRDTEEWQEGGGGTRAYGPSDFPEVDFAEPLLPEIVEAGPEAPPSEVFRVPPPPFSEDIYPCSECHADMEVDPTPRELEDFHDDIELHHGPEDRWCFDCHNPSDRDRLRLINGKLIGFDESYLLCGQCHGTIFRDWREGIHGRRRGYWSGAKSYLLCAHCHNPHSPRFKPLAPLAAPVRPEYLRRSVEEAR